MFGKLRILMFLCLISPIQIFSLGAKVTWEDLDWEVISSEHFDVHYPKGYDTLGRTALLYVEEANIVLSKKLQHNLSQVIPIFIYPSHSHFQMTNIIFTTLDEGVGGFTERIKKRVVVPYMGTYDGFRHVLTHELVHAFQYDILLGTGLGGILASQYAPNLPLWLVEGMAEYLSIGWDETADMTIREALVSDTLPSIEQMTTYQIRSGYMLYKGGQSVMRYIAETYSEHKIGELLKDLRDQRNIEDAIKTNFGVSFKQFDKDWRLWVKRVHLKAIEKRVDQEEAVLISEHFEDQSFLNMHPAISPDGKKVAYFSIRNFFPALVIRDAKEIKTKPDFSVNTEPDEPNEEVLVLSSDNHEFYQLHLLDNRLSFSPDSKKLFFCVRSGGKDHLYLFDIESRSVERSYTPAVDMIQYPKLSYDGKYAVFSASILGQTDVYMLDLQTSKVTQLTFDLFSEKDPSLSGDNKFILYSSNSNKEKDLENNQYHIFEQEIETKKTTQLTFAKGRQATPSYYYRTHNNRILYVSNQTGISNAYLLDKNDPKPMQITDIPGGVFEPQLDQKYKKMIFTLYRSQGYDIALRNAPNSPDEVIEEPENMVTFDRADYPIYPAGLSNYKVRNYDLRFSPDWFIFGFQYSSALGFGGVMQIAMSDYLGNHTINGYIDYLQNRDALNFNINYGYLKHRTNLYFGVYKASNFFSIFNLTDLSSINDFLYNPNFLLISINRFGGYATASYPFTPFLRLDGTVEIARIEQDFKSNVAENFKRNDVFKNIYSTNVALIYNNVLYSPIGPLRGFLFRASVEHATDTTGRDANYNRQSFDIRYYYLLGRRYIFAFRTFGGNVVGRDKNLFPYQIGGFNTIRSHPFLAYQGTTALITNLEFRFPLIEAIALGFPVPSIIRGFSGVFFVDIGTAFSNANSFKGFDDSTGRLRDIKASFGFGIRFVLFPGLILKIDWGTPWDLQTALPIGKWQGIFSIGYEF